jgi:hypothetical protein
MQRIDTTVANLAPWIAAALGIFSLFPLFIVGYELTIRRNSDKRADDFKAEVRNELTRSNDTLVKQFEEFRAEIRHELSRSQSEITSIIERKMAERVDYIITTEVRRITNRAESEYSRNLAQIETVCYSMIQNEFLDKWVPKGELPSAIENMHVFRYLLMLLVGGSGSERLTALHRLASEYVNQCGPSTRSFLAVLLMRLETDARFARQDLSRALEELKHMCLSTPGHPA